MARELWPLPTWNELERNDRAPFILPILIQLYLLGPYHPRFWFLVKSSMDKYERQNKYLQYGSVWRFLIRLYFYSPSTILRNNLLRIEVLNTFKYFEETINFDRFLTSQESSIDPRQIIADLLECHELCVDLIERSRSNFFQARIHRYRSPTWRRSLIEAVKLCLSITEKLLFHFYQSTLWCEIRRILRGSVVVKIVPWLIADEEYVELSDQKQTGDSPFNLTQVEKIRLLIQVRRLISIDLPICLSKGLLHLWSNSICEKDEVSWNDFHLLGLLLYLGANPNQLDVNGNNSINTLLEAEVRERNELVISRCIHLLLSAGAHYDSHGSACSDNLLHKRNRKLIAGRQELACFNYQTLTCLAARQVIAFGFDLSKMPIIVTDVLSLHGAEREHCDCINDS